jgi:hypothetical protein
MKRHNAIHNVSSFHKRILVDTNNLVKERLNSNCQNFSLELVNAPQETNGSVLADSISIKKNWKQGDNAIVESLHVKVSSMESME